MSNNYGDMIADQTFALKRVRIYSGGYVRVSGAFFGANSAAFERLLSIEDSSDVTKKSALGRSAGAALTMGASWMLSPNKRGDVYLAIVTDTTTHMLHEDPPTDRGMKAAKKLGAAGRAAVQSQTRTAAGPATMGLVPLSTGSDSTPPSKRAAAARPAINSDNSGPGLRITTEDNTHDLHGLETGSPDKLIDAWAALRAHATTSPALSTEVAEVILYAGKNIVLYESGHVLIRDMPMTEGQDYRPERVLAIGMTDDQSEPLPPSDAPAANDPSPISGPQADTPLVNRLRELKTLLDEGLIDDGEYELLRGRALENL